MPDHASWFHVCFFFFQAEDGIRDGHVTGVQTCALPISVLSSQVRPQRLMRRRRQWRTSTVRGRRAVVVADGSWKWRSEERRVGKECSYRWAGGHWEKIREREVQKRTEEKTEVLNVRVRE